MGHKSKRTYNLSPETVERVRVLASRADLASTQDAVVELAIDQLYRQVTDREDAALWTRALGDEAFRSEMKALAGDLDGPTSWPAE